MPNIPPRGNNKYRTHENVPNNYCVANIVYIYTCIGYPHTQKGEHKDKEWEPKDKKRKNP